MSDCLRVGVLKLCACADLHVLVLLDESSTVLAELTAAPSIWQPYLKAFFQAEIPPQLDEVHPKTALGARQVIAIKAITARERSLQRFIVPTDATIRGCVGFPTAGEHSWSKRIEECIKVCAHAHTPQH